MKFASFVGPAGVTAGIVRDGTVAPLRGGDRGDSTGQPIGLLAHIAAGADPVTTGVELPLESVELTAPIPAPRRNIICAGQNYADHVREFDQSGYANADRGIPEHPVVFTKATTTVIGPHDEIPLHADRTEALDYEGELAVIIGTGGTNIRAEDAMAHVWGYTIVNDVSARDLQHAHRQWFLGKSLDRSCPMGPVVVTADEFDWRDLLIETRVNGELRQHTKTTDLIFGVPELIAAISAGTTLLPGDIIATGTPSGVGVGFDPPRFLLDGDVIEITINGIGTLVNTVGAGS